jgi:hypothetical protein
MQHHIFSFPFYTQLSDDFILSRFCVSSDLGLGQSTTNRYLHIIQTTDGSIADSFNNLFDKKKKDKKNGRG